MSLTMIISVAISPFTKPLKAIEIELPEISSRLGIIEVPREYYRPKSVGIMYHEGTAVWLPAYDIGQAIGLDLGQNSVQFEWEGHAFARWLL